MSLEWTWLKYHGKDLQSLMAEVSDHMEPARTLIAVHNYQHLCIQHRTDKFYILSRFVKVVSSLRETESGLKLKAEFEDVSYCGQANQTASLFCVTFLKNVASKLNEYVCEKKLVTGDMVHFIHPMVISLDVNRVSLPLLLVTSSTSSKQLVHLWRQHSNLFVDSYPLFSDRNYTRMAFYGYNSTGSLGQAMHNLLKLVEGKGIVTSMDDIANKKGPQKCVAIAKYKKLVSPLKVYNGTAEIQVSFEEVSTYPRSNGAKSFTNSFNAYLFGSIASELHESLKNNLLEPGDLVAICHPVLEKKTAAPVEILFSPDAKISLLVLKNQHEKITKFQLSKYQTRHYSEQGMSVARLNKEFNFNNEIFDILLFENLNKEHDILKLFIKELKVNGNILSLNSFANNKQIIKNTKDCFVILSCILNVVLPLNVTNCKSTAILFARELNHNGSFGCFLKIVLYDEFAEKMCLALQEKQIILGDFMALANPCVFPNPTYVSQNYREEEPFLFEMTSTISNQKIIVCKVCRTDKDKVKISDRYSKNLSKCCIVCTVNKSNDDFQIDLDNSIKKTNNLTINNDLNSQNNNDVPSSIMKTTYNQYCQTAPTDPDEIICSEENNVELTISEEDLSIIPFFVEKPDTGDGMDFVSGYCELKCHNMFVYTVMKMNAAKELLCPNCLLKVRLSLCFQVLGLARSGRHVCALLVDQAAETFLQVTCFDFLNNSEKRDSALAGLREKIPHSYSQVGNLEKHYKLELTQVSLWWYKELTEQ